MTDGSGTIEPPVVLPVRAHLQGVNVCPSWEAGLMDATRFAASR